MRDTPLNGRVFAPVLLALGLAIAVQTLVVGGGPLSARFIIGLLFAALGGLRLYASFKRSRHRG